MIKLFNWLNSSERWHDLGHVMFGAHLFLISSIFCSPVLSFGIVCALALAKELFVDGHFKDLFTEKGHDGLWDISHYIVGCVCGNLILMGLSS